MKTSKIGLLMVLLLLLFSASILAAAPIKTLIIDGRQNKAHDWVTTTPVLKKCLESTGLFSVEVATLPPIGQSVSQFHPRFSDYRLLVLNFDDDEAWPQDTQTAFLDFVSRGGGVVIYHAADNAFPQWKEYNEIIGVGGWRNRDEKSGPYIRFRAGNTYFQTAPGKGRDQPLQIVRTREGRIFLDTSPGKGGSHGPQAPFVVKTWNPRHPIMRGLPDEWIHTKDELYDRLRGPAKNVEVLATALSEKEKKGSGEREPVLFTIRYGKGRIFHTILGHAVANMKCVGFIVTLQRGAEWAATGKVRQQVPRDFPTADKESLRETF